MPDFPLTAVLAQTAHVEGQFALEILGILAAAALVAFLLGRWPAATIPAYLIAGAVIGPYGLELVGHGAGAESVASLATILLMFIIGLHLDIGGGRSGFASAAVITIISTVLIIALLYPVARAFGVPGPAAMALAMALSISSTAVVLRILEQKRELHRVHGRLTFGILLTQDLVAVVLMALLPVLAVWARGPGAPATTSAAGLSGPLGTIARVCFSLGGIGVMIAIGRYALPWMLRSVAGSGEALLVVSSAIALAAAVAAAALGFSPELGAFLAGFILSSTPFRYQLSGQLVPLRDLFLAVFFTAIGLGLPIGDVLQHWWAVLIAVFLVIAIKSVAIGLTSWAAGASAAVAAYAGLAMAQGSEFSLVILRQAKDKGVFQSGDAGYGIAAVVLTMVATPGLFELARAAARRLVRVRPAPWVKTSAHRGNPVAEGELALAEERAHANEASGHVGSAIIAGFGPVGRAVADVLEKQGVKITVIELNPRTVERQYGLGRSIVYGDVANPEVMDRAGLSRADAVILTVPDEEAVLRACRFVRLQRPDVFIAARVNALSKGLQAMQLGADHAVVEELATAEAMAAQVMVKLRQREAGEDSGPRLYQF